MKCIKSLKFLALPLLLTLIFTSVATSTPASATLSEDRLQVFSQNNILFYDPSACISVSGGNCGADVTGSTWQERLREVVENYGIFFMNAQIEYGVPWEIPIIHGHMESHFGLADPSVAKSTENCGYYNWQGYKYGSNSLFGISEAEMGSCKVYHSDGGFGSQYKNLADMYMSFYVDYLRNGAYDAAYEYAQPSNFDPRAFLAKETDGIYCAVGCSAGYTSVYDSDIDLIHEIAAEHGWPTSKELMEQYSIPKGGNWSDTWGDIKKYINAEPHSLSVDCSSMTTLGDTSGINFRNGAHSSSASSSSSVATSPTGSVSGTSITWIGDSYSVGAHTIIEEKFPGITFGSGIENSSSYIQSNKGVGDRYGGGSSNPPALTILQNIISRGELKPYLVLAVGTNAGWDDDEVTQFRTLMSGHDDTKVIFVNSKAKAHLLSDDIGSNERLKALADSNPNYYLADWVSAYDDKYFANNSTHPDANGGYEKWVEVIYAALDSASGGNCADGGEFTWYGQYEDQWKDYPFGSSKVGPSGCGPTSFAMMATVLLGYKVTPDETARIAGDAGMYIPGSGSSWEITRVLAEHYGLEYAAHSASSTQEAVDLINSLLKEGWMIHTSGAGSMPFTSGGHYIGIRGIASDGNWLIADSGHSEENSTTKTWNPTDLVNAGMALANIKAIRATSTPASCGNICKSANVTGTNGFQSVDDAQIIINSYNSANLDAYGLVTPATGDKHHNCVAFSTWFINNYTEISYTDPPNGNQLVDDFYNKNKDKYPDLTISDQPTVYSIASWSVAGQFTSSGNHTGVVVGIDESKDLLLIAEAGWNIPSFTGVHERSLSGAVASGYKYININKYLKPNTELK